MTAGDKGDKMPSVVKMNQSQITEQTDKSVVIHSAVRGFWTGSVNTSQLVLLFHPRTVLKPLRAHLIFYINSLIFS